MERGRAAWVALAGRMAGPVLGAFSAGRLSSELPHEGGEDRRAYAALEAVARLLLGLAPWFGLEAGLGEPERALRDGLLEQARGGLARALDPGAPAELNFSRGRQPLVDAALLAAALLRAPRALLDPLPARTRAGLVEALRATRAIEPYWNNWLLFPAVVEVCLARLGQEWREAPVAAALRMHEEWYVGDGVYSDGPRLALDYYNSIMIHPLLLEVLDGIAPVTRRWEGHRAAFLERARRHAESLERLISPEGTYPPLGRSLAYRAGVFHHLGVMAWRRDLPPSLEPGAVRCALEAVLARQMGAPGTFDAGGWLTLGFSGHQAGLAEDYVCTGSAYFAAAALVPLGLAPGEPFWAAPDAEWTSRRLWAGREVFRDRKLEPTLPD